MKPIFTALLCIVAGTLIVLSGLWNLGLFAEAGEQFAWSPSQLLAIVQIIAGPALFILALRHLRSQ